MSPFRKICLLVFLLLSCDRPEEEAIAPNQLVASLTYEIEGEVCGTEPLLYVFQSQTEGAANWIWDFGDGQQSTEQSPTKIYDKAGSYKVTYIAFAGGESDTIQVDVEVPRDKEWKGPSISLEYDQDDLHRTAFTFTIDTEGSPYTLSFGDGTALVDGTESTIAHTYPGLGAYQVTAMVRHSSGLGCATRRIQISP